MKTGLQLATWRRVSNYQLRLRRGGFCQRMRCLMYSECRLRWRALRFCGHSEPCRMHLIQRGDEYGAAGFSPYHILRTAMPAACWRLFVLVVRGPVLELLRSGSVGLFRIIFQSVGHPHTNTNTFCLPLLCVRPDLRALYWFKYSGTLPQRRQPMFWQLQVSG